MLNQTVIVGRLVRDPELYETENGSDGEIATLMTDPNEAGIDEAEVMHRINSTFTDENGDYLFRGLNPMKKYYVTFEYNGQTCWLCIDYIGTTPRTNTSE